MVRYQFPPDEEGPAWKWGYHVICDASGIEGTHKGCGCSSAWGETQGEAITAWNRRAIPSTVSGEIGWAAQSAIDRFLEGETRFLEVRNEKGIDHYLVPVYLASPANPAETQAVEVGND